MYRDITISFSVSPTIILGGHPPAPLEAQVINKLSIDVWIEIQLFENLESEGAKKLKILRKSPLKLSN